MSLSANQALNDALTFHNWGNIYGRHYSPLSTSYLFSFFFFFAIITAACDTHLLLQNIMVVFLPQTAHLLVFIIHTSI
jgi:hypothetical protein